MAAKITILSVSGYLTNFTIQNYLYPAIWQILLSKIIFIELYGKFYYPELFLSGYLANFTIRNCLYLAIWQILLSGIICICLSGKFHYP